MSIVIISSEEFFRPIVKEAIQKRKLEENYFVEEYLVNLLNFFIDSKNYIELSNKTLAELYLESNAVEYSKKIELLRKLGDISLYLSGLFSEFLSRKIVGLDYYVNMGKLAYSSLVPRVPRAKAIVFKTIANSFIDYVDVLSYIQYKHFNKPNKDSDLINLYDRYMQTGSKLSKEFLTELGFFIPQNNNKTQ
jgi:hypothetical protein